MNRRRLSSCFLALTLAACGGGGGGGGGGPGPEQVNSVAGSWDVYRTYVGEPERGPDLAQWSNSGTGYGIRMEAACSTYVIPDGYTAIAGEIHGSDLWLSYSGARWDGVLGDDLSSMSGTFSDTRGSGVWRAQKVSSAHPCATYEVYGGDQYLPCGGVQGYTPEANGYTFLGSATTTQTFPGTYSYYVVLTRDYNVIHLDTVEDAAGNHYGSLSTGNTADHTNIGGVADGQYATVGAGRVSGGGYVDIDASAVRPASITVVLVP